MKRSDLMNEFLAAYFVPGKPDGASINATNNQGVVTVRMRDDDGKKRVAMTINLEAFRGFVDQAHAALRELEK